MSSFANVPPSAAATSILGRPVAGDIDKYERTRDTVPLSVSSSAQRPRVRLLRSCKGSSEARQRRGAWCSARRSDGPDAGRGRARFGR
jgi:hypothetical protein